ncbi:MAG: hypothetical protein K0S61_3039 [Anaerocolumna sp.]|jgi:hypothetical protein|nr:hypothetical protein [Anaerocolumna sp.]
MEGADAKYSSEDRLTTHKLTDIQNNIVLDSYIKCSISAHILYLNVCPTVHYKKSYPQLRFATAPSSNH